MSRARLAILAVCAACGPGARREREPKRVANVVTPSRVIHTCALASPRRIPVPQLTYRSYLGRIGDRTWVLVQRDGKVALATMDDRGALAISPLPFAAELVTTTSIEGSRLWIVSDVQGLGKDEQVLHAIDIAGSTVTIRAPESLTGSALPGVSSFAVGKRRALFYTFAGGAGYGMWDRERRVPIAVTAPKLGGIDAPPNRCIGDRCFSIAVPGDGPTRRLSVYRFDPATGSIETEKLAEDHLAEFLMIPVGDHTLAVWTSYSRAGLYGRELDDHGRPTGPEITLDPGRARDPAIVGEAPLRIAYRSIDSWNLVTFADDRKRFTSTIPIGFGDYLFVLSATTADGVLSVGIGSHTDYDGSIHSWRSRGEAVYTPDGAAKPDPLIRIWERRGGGHGGFAGFPLATPGHAATLALPSDEYQGDGELVVLREPCP